MDNQDVKTLYLLLFGKYITKVAGIPPVDHFGLSVDRKESGDYTLTVRGNTAPALDQEDIEIISYFFGTNLVTQNEVQVEKVYTNSNYDTRHALKTTIVGSPYQIQLSEARFGQNGGVSQYRSPARKQYATYLEQRNFV